MYPHTCDQPVARGACAAYDQKISHRERRQYEPSIPNNRSAGRCSGQFRGLVGTGRRVALEGLGARATAARARSGSGFDSAYVRPDGVQGQDRLPETKDSSPTSTSPVSTPQALQHPARYCSTMSDSGLRAPSAARATRRPPKRLAKNGLQLNRFPDKLHCNARRRGRLLLTGRIRSRCTPRAHHGGRARELSRLRHR